MADEFVEVVNTTLTSTELPSNNSTYTLKTAGAAESFAIKDIGIKTASSVAEYSFLLNDFESLSFGAGESGVASGLDLLPQSGTLKIKGKNIPIDSESILFSVDEGGSSQYKSIKEQVISPELCRPNSSRSTFNNTYETLEAFGVPYTNATTWNSYSSYSWTDGDRFRALRGTTNHTSNGRFEYADTSGGSISYISKTNFEYVPDLNKIFYIDTATSTVKASDTNASISFSTFATPFTGSWNSTLVRLHYQKGWLFLFENAISDSNLKIIALNISTGIQLRFTGSGTGYYSGTSTSTSMGFCVNYDPDTDEFYLFRSDYQTSTTLGIGRSKFPKTLTEMNAYSANTTITDSFSQSFKVYERATSSAGPFAYQYPHYFRGSSASSNIFYLADPSVSDRPVYYYDFSSNALTKIDDGFNQYGTYTTTPLIQQRSVNATDESEYGGSFSSIAVRVTGIKTT